MAGSSGLSRRADDGPCTAVTAPVLAPRSVPPEELLGGVAGVGAQARGDHPPVLGLEPRHLRQALVEIVLALRYQGLSEPHQPVLDAGVERAVDHHADALGPGTLQQAAAGVAG